MMRTKWAAACDRIAAATAYFLEAGVPPSQKISVQYALEQTKRVESDKRLSYDDALALLEEAADALEKATEGRLK